MSSQTKWVCISAAMAVLSTMLLMLSGQSRDVSLTVGITLFTAILWVTEALPIPATSLIPFVAFPMAGVLTHKEAASALGSHVILLLMGAFMLSKAVERSRVHERLALYMIQLTGAKSASKLILAFLMASALLSMWISNTATTLMMLPIALAVIKPLNNPKLTMALLLGIAYAASLGGVGTPIGTPPNVIFMSVYEQSQGYQYTFLDWMKTGIPVVLLGIPIMAWWLGRSVGPIGDYQLPKVGAWRTHEKRVLITFAFVACAWVFKPIWTAWLGMPNVGDSSIALAGVLLMFLIPTGSNGAQEEKEEKVQRLLDWPTATDIPWGMLLLFAGGICIAKGFAASGLSEIMGNGLTALSEYPVPLMILGICLFVTFITEITSNTAAATLLMPILASAGVAANIDPALLMIPAAMSASCAFMLPVATAPNAIVYGTQTFTIKQMVREGSVLNVILAVVISIVCYFTL